MVYKVLKEIVKLAFYYYKILLNYLEFYENSNNFKFFNFLMVLKNVLMK
jgi:hypothetical protein